MARLAVNSADDLSFWLSRMNLLLGFLDGYSYTFEKLNFFFIGLKIVSKFKTITEVDKLWFLYHLYRYVSFIKDKTLIIHVKYAQHLKNNKILLKSWQ